MREEPYNDIEEEKEGNEGEKGKEINNPFDPKKVDIAVEQVTIDQLASRIEHKEINLFPEFQRNGNLWDSSRMSQLIESILIKLPLPAMYFDVADEDEWIVVDGLQRLSTIKRFVVDKYLKLKKMEFLSDLEGKTFDELDRSFQRRIKETNITIFKIKKGTPKKVLTSLFHRINTGGLKLTSQEIRHALNQGIGTKFLKDISEEPWLKNIIHVSPKRMLNQELILRFIAFYRNGYEQYQPSLQNFLDEEMQNLNEDSTDKDRNLYSIALKESLELSQELFGKKAFSKALLDIKKMIVINRSLFESTTVNFAQLSKEEKGKLIENKDDFIVAYKELIKDTDFDNSITVSTSLKEHVEYRHRIMRELILKYI